MAKKRDRVIAGFFAGIFIFSVVSLAAGVVYQMIQDRKKPAAVDSIQATTKPEEKAMDPNALQGKPLAGFTPVASITELQKIDTTPGTGNEVKASNTIKVDYTGAVAATGVVFQSSKDTGQPVEFPLNGVIAGWTQGIPGMKEGGTRRLLIPAELAYGANPPQGSGIPPNADLVFDVILHKITK